MPERRENNADILSEVSLSSNVSNQCKKLLSVRYCKYLRYIIYG